MGAVTSSEECLHWVEGGVSLGEEGSHKVDPEGSHWLDHEQELLLGCEKIFHLLLFGLLHPEMEPGYRLGLEGGLGVPQRPENVTMSLHEPPCLRVLLQWVDPKAPLSW